MLNNNSSKKSHKKSQKTSENSSNWLKTNYGQEFYNTELQILDKHLAHFFGFHILQVGCHNINYINGAVKINHKLILSENNLELNDNRSVVLSRETAIPLETASIDVVILSHALEFADDNEPHSILREVDRILLPEGHIVILGFNPWSLWRFRKLFTLSSNGFPWSGKWYSCFRICDWLNLLNYQISYKYYYFYRPCINNAKIMNYTKIFDKIGTFIPFGAAGFCIIAEKRQEGMTPIKANWQNNIEFAGSTRAWN